MDLELAKRIEAKMKLKKEECPYLHGDICMDGTNICRCFFDFSDDCRFVRERLGKI